MKPKSCVILSVLISTLAMCYVDAFMKPPYFLKSIIKLIIFLGFPIIYFIRCKDNSFKEILVAKKKDLQLAMPLGLAVYFVIIIAYFVCNRFIDLSSIKDTLATSMDVNADNFIYVALYISFINSLLEEFFFRGYAFLILKKESGRPFAYLFSSFMFAFYHVGMTSGWFNPIIYILSLLGLFIGGCLFNYLNEKCTSIYPSWIVHMCANFGINTIGFMMFNII